MTRKGFLGPAALGMTVMWLLAAQPLPAADASRLTGEIDAPGLAAAIAKEKGRVVLVNFWATWCAPCRREMPALVKLQDELGGKGLQVVAVTVDTESYRDKVIAYADTAKLNFPVWFGSTANMEPFGFSVMLPSTAIVDRDGKIVARYEGVLDDAAVRKELEGLLAP